MSTHSPHATTPRWQKPLRAITVGCGLVALIATSPPREANNATGVGRVETTARFEVHLSRRVARGVDSAEVSVRFEAFGSPALDAGPGMANSLALVSDPTVRVEGPNLTLYGVHDRCGEADPCVLEFEVSTVAPTDFTVNLRVSSTGGTGLCSDDALTIPDDEISIRVL